VPEKPPLAEVGATFREAQASLEHLDDLIASEARLLTQLLEPVEEAIQTYSVRYLQVFDQMTAHAEKVRQTMEALPDRPAFRAFLLNALAADEDELPVIELE